MKIILIYIYEYLFFLLIISVFLNIRYMTFDLDSLQTASNIIAISMLILIGLLNFDIIISLKSNKDRMSMPLAMFLPLFSDIK
jgi:hypothetical protein